MTTTADVYKAVDALILKLRGCGNTELADVLDHRVHKVAWTSGPELLDELQTLLSQKMNDPNMPAGEIRGVLEMIDAARLR